MLNEAALPVIGWLVLLSLPVVGFALRQRTGFLIGGAGAAFASLSYVITTQELDFSGVGFFAAVSLKALVILPELFLSSKDLALAVALTVGGMVAISLQVMAMRLWGEKGVLAVVGSEMVLLSACCAVHAYLTSSNADFGLGGIEEALLSMSGIVVATFSALLVTTFVKPRRTKIVSV